MAEDNRQRPEARAVDHRQVGMTKPGRAHLDENFAWAWPIKLELLDRERPALRVRRRQPALSEDGGDGLHEIMVSVARFLLRTDVRKKTLSTRESFFPKVAGHAGHN
jgi:hypothetical protein